MERHTVHGRKRFFKKFSKGTLLCIVFTPFRRSIGDSDALTREIRHPEEKEKEVKMRKKVEK